MTLMVFSVIGVFVLILQTRVQDDPADLPGAGEDHR